MAGSVPPARSPPGAHHLPTALQSTARRCAASWTSACAPSTAPAVSSPRDKPTPQPSPTPRHPGPLPGHTHAPRSLGAGRSRFRQRRRESCSVAALLRQMTGLLDTEDAGRLAELTQQGGNSTATWAPDVSLINPQISH